jgi:hypothetical protein
MYSRVGPRQAAAITSENAPVRLRFDESLSSLANFAVPQAVQGIAY